MTDRRARVLSSILSLAEPLHQCAKGRCGGTFTCAGCERVVGWCFGAGDELGAEHCDDCWHDRLAVLHRIKGGFNTRAALASGVKKAEWRREPLVVAAELVEDGFLELRANGRFYLTDRAREALS